MGNSSVAAQERRYEKWKAEQKDAPKPKPGELLPPMPTGPVEKVRPKKRKPKGPAQKQIKHRWAYLVRWYEEIREFNPAPMGHQRMDLRMVESYKTMFWLEMEPWEVDTLMKLDRAWFKTLPKTAKDRDA